MLHRRDATQKYSATLARGTAPSNGRKKVDVRSFFAFHGVFLQVSSVRTNRAEICTRTSVQVAIGLFPIDSVRAEFLLLSLLFFAHCLHLPFTCTSCSFFCATSLLLSSSCLLLPLFPFYSPPSSSSPSLLLLLLFRSTAFCNLDTNEIKETLY